MERTRLPGDPRRTNLRKVARKEQSMLKIWGRTSSINVQKVMWAVAELGLAHERMDAGGAFGGLSGPDYGP